MKYNEIYIMNFKNEKDNLIRQMLLQICIKEKKINLTSFLGFKLTLRKIFSGDH